MKQYIPKSTVVAEIERINNSIGSDRFLSEYEKGCNQGKEEVCDTLRNFLDTLEAKEIDSESLDEKAIAKYLYEKKGYPISLNGNLPSYEETMKDANQYINYKKEQFIKKAAIWFNDYFASHDVYGVIAPFDTEEEMFEDFKKYMNR